MTTTNTTTTTIDPVIQGQIYTLALEMETTKAQRNNAVALHQQHLQGFNNQLRDAQNQITTLLKDTVATVVPPVIVTPEASAASTVTQPANPGSITITTPTGQKLSVSPVTTPANS